MDGFVVTIALIGIVVVVASLLSGAIERSGIPLVAVFLLLGAALGPWGMGIADVDFHSTELHVLAMLGLALLLFSDAVTLDVRQLRTRRYMLMRLLGPGTLAPAIITALAGWLFLGFHPAAAAILGAALASTDPVLLRTVLRSRALPEAPRLALRLETGMNDVVLLPIVVLAMLLLPREGGTGVTSAMDVHVGRSLLGLFVLGPVLGAAVGWVGITALGSVRAYTGVRRDYESLYALGLAFSSFAAAEAVGGSGFVAAFAAGLLVASRDVELCDCFLEYGEATAEMLLLLTFVALGMSLIWLGLGALDGRMIAFVVVALVARPAVLYPVLGGVGLDDRERKLVAAFGPRGLSSLLLALLPVFAGIPGAERIFTVAAVVVLASVVVHGGGAAFYLRRHARAGTGGPITPPMPLRRPTPAEAVPATPAIAATGGAALPILEEGDARAGLITIEEMQDLEARGEPLVLVDARADRNRDGDPLQAAGSVRVRPDDPVRDATELRLSQRATLVVYCA